VAMQSDWQAQSRVREPRGGERQTSWGSFLVFAGVMLAVVGLLQAIAGLTALLNDEVLVVRSDGTAFGLDFTTWGWFHLLLGAVALVASFLLLRGNMVGRSLAVGVAVVSALNAFAFLPAQPFWSALIIGIDVLVIYAVVAHGNELASRR
jgi:hypothetical protein